MTSMRTLASLVRGPSVISVSSKYHGLGNRVRAVLGSYALAKHEGRGFAYSWPTGTTFGARMDELWDFDLPVISPAASKLLEHLYPPRDHTLDWLDGSARTKRLWRIKTPHALQLPLGCEPWEHELRAIRPAKEIADRVVETFQKRPHYGPYIGVMIRANVVAHQETLRHSPVSWFVSRMSEIREAFPTLPFYISADTKEAYQHVANKFEFCFGLSEKGTYNSLPALSSSVVDLYMLASSCHILGPHYSSFPELAYLLAGSELRLETSKSSEASVLRANTPITSSIDPLLPHVRVQLSP